MSQIATMSLKMRTIAQYALSQTCAYYLAIVYCLHLLITFSLVLLQHFTKVISIPRKISVRWIRMKRM